MASAINAGPSDLLIFSVAVTPGLTAGAIQGRPCGPRIPGATQCRPFWASVASLRVLLLTRSRYLIRWRATPFNAVQTDVLAGPEPPAFMIQRQNRSGPN